MQWRVKFITNQACIVSHNLQCVILGNGIFGTKNTFVGAAAYVTMHIAPKYGVC